MPERVAIVVLVTTDDGLSEAIRRLRPLGINTTEVVAPTDARRLVLAPVDESKAAHIVSCLRAEGRIAVLRPSGGPQLAAWMRHTRPITIGDRINVCFAWSEHDRRGFSGLVELDPNGGFGTGAHPSTRLLLETLMTRVSGGERVLDVGCGSGVLGLSALRLGASKVVAVDTDAPAIDATRRNAALNGFQLQVEARLAPIAAIDGPFDVIVANIGWTALVELASELVARMSPNGWIALSGISHSHCSLVAASLRPLQVLENPTYDEWSALVAGRRSAGGQL